MKKSPCSWPSAREPCWAVPKSIKSASAVIDKNRHFVRWQCGVHELTASIAILLKAKQCFAVSFRMPAIEGERQTSGQTAQTYLPAVYPPNLLVNSTTEIEHQQSVAD